MYGLPPSKLAESIAAERRHVPSSYRRELSTGQGIENRIRMLSISSKTGGDGASAQGSIVSPDVLVLMEQDEDGDVAESSSPLSGGDEEKSPTCKNSIQAIEGTSSSKNPTPSLSPSSSVQTLPVSSQNASGTNATQLTTSSSGEATPADCSSAEDGRSNVPTPDQSVRSENGETPLRATSPSHGNGTDQLKLLTAASRPNGSDRSREVSPAHSERIDYEKLTMEAAALSREKWKQNEGIPVMASL